MDILLWVLIGLVAGWLASALMHSRHGIVVDLLLGLVGSLLGGLVVRAIMQAHGPFADANVEKVRVASQTLTRTSWSVMSHIVVAVLGAVVVLAIHRLLFSSRRRGFRR